MNYIFHIIFGIFFSQTIFAQVETVAEVRAREIFNRETIIDKFKLNENAVFVINGLPYSQNDSLKLNDKLKSINQQILTDFTYIKNSGQIGIGDKDIVVIKYAILQPKNYIKEKLNELNKLFSDNYISSSQHIHLDAKDPILFIDNQKIFHTEIKKKLSSLKIQEIADISIKKETQSSEMFGQNAKNGIVIIWTKNGLNKASR
ncbi:hypothetical protein [Epilithonimonas sp.]|uniref:hypothetical protein n=1 Tax=Epilithonimonas sp. TaxID=2894511 RepID=UPI00289F0083|nr:hypothetical protein [Epilithonimonas sp.]